MKKVFDVFLFFNELDILELRLKMLNDVVDFFVITECDFTFSGKPKSLIFAKSTLTKIYACFLFIIWIAFQILSHMRDK